MAKKLAKLLKKKSKGKSLRSKRAEAWVKGKLTKQTELEFDRA